MQRAPAAGKAAGALWYIRARFRSAVELSRATRPRGLGTPGTPTRSGTPGRAARACGPRARVAKLADAPDLGSGGVTRGGSNPPSRTRLELARPGAPER